MLVLRPTRQFPISSITATPGVLILGATLAGTTSLEVLKNRAPLYCEVLESMSTVQLLSIQQTCALTMLRTHYGRRKRRSSVVSGGGQMKVPVQCSREDDADNCVGGERITIICRDGGIIFTRTKTEGKKLTHEMYSHVSLDTNSCGQFRHSPPWRKRSGRAFETSSSLMLKDMKESISSSIQTFRVVSKRGPALSIILSVIFVRPSISPRFFTVCLQEKRQRVPSTKYKTILSKICVL